jgi:hypothetical protein
MTDLTLVLLIMLGIVVYLLVAQALLGLRSQLARRQVQAEAWEVSRRIQEINRAAQAEIVRELIQRGSRQRRRP